MPTIAREGTGAFGSVLYRYLFYGWLFRDAAAGSPLERAAALRHNRERARWLPLYIRRWLGAGALLVTFELACERMLDAPLLAAAAAVLLVFVLLQVVLTAVCWLFLSRARRP